jgi:transposase
MEYIGIDVHQRESQVCIVDGDGHVLLERRVRTRGERFGALLEGRGHARVVLEASTESEWVAQALEALGYEVIVADPNFAPMYATRSRRVKTDRRDARTLADACRLGAYRATHRTSATQRTVRAQLAVREALVRTRTRYISVLRAVLRRDGVRVRVAVPRRSGSEYRPSHCRRPKRGWSPRWWHCSSPSTGSWRPSRPSWRAGWRRTRQRGDCARCRAWVR